MTHQENHTRPKVSISEITFSSGQTISFQPDDKIILVGANNSGKSQTLRELVDLTHRNNSKGLVVQNITLNKQGSTEDVQQFINKKYIKDFYSTFTIQNIGFSEYSIHHYWENNENKLDELAPVFIKQITANERLSICESAESIKRGHQKTKPQHTLYDDEFLMNKISNLFKRAFGQQLMINFRGGSEIPIHVGTPPDAEKYPDRVSDEYVNIVESNPLLHEQGDGIKSYTGILFDAIVEDFDITLIDEPEAFLHPPQMKELGRALASEVKGQLFIATHSSDILKGVLEETKGNVRVLRIQRKGNKNYISEVENSIIKELWEKPILKYSYALDAIFHEQAVICEDNSDCRVFNFIFDILSLESELKLPDTAFIPSGGKDQIHIIAKALIQTGLPVKAIYDFDILNNKDKFKSAIKAFTSETSIHSNLMDSWRKINSNVTQNNPSGKSDEKIRDAIIKLINEKKDEFPPSLNEIKEILKPDSTPWGKLKNQGLSGLSKGDITSLYIKDFNPVLQEIGIYVNPYGETENLCITIGGHGPKFVENVLLAYGETAENEQDLDTLKKFAKEVFLDD